MSHKTELGCGRIASFDAGHDGRAVAVFGEALHVETGAGEELMKRVGVASFITGIFGAVVDALVSNERLQQFDRGANLRFGHHERHTTDRRSRSQGSAIDFLFAAIREGALLPIVRRLP